MYQSGEGYKRISKALDIPWNTVKTVIIEWRKYGATVTKYQSILAQNLQASARKLKMKRNSSFSTTTQSIHQINKRMASPEDWSFGMAQPEPRSESIENLWGDLKKTVHRRCPRNLTDLEHFCKEEWANIAKSRCAMLIDSYPKRLSGVIKSKGASTKY